MYFIITSIWPSSCTSSALQHIRMYIIGWYGEPDGTRKCKVILSFVSRSICHSESCYKLWELSQNNMARKRKAIGHTLQNEDQSASHRPFERFTTCIYSTTLLWTDSRSLTKGMSSMGPIQQITHALMNKDGFKHVFQCFVELGPWIGPLTVCSELGHNVSSCFTFSLRWIKPFKATY